MFLTRAILSSYTALTAQVNWNIPRDAIYSIASTAYDKRNILALAGLSLISSLNVASEVVVYMIFSLSDRCKRTFKDQRWPYSST